MCLDKSSKTKRFTQVKDTKIDSFFSWHGPLNISLLMWIARFVNNLYIALCLGDATIQNKRRDV